MTTSRQDLAFGRQGGRIVPWKDQATETCEVCGKPLAGGQERTHIACRPVEAPVEEPPSLF